MTIISCGLFTIVFHFFYQTTLDECFSTNTPEKKYKDIVLGGYITRKKEKDTTTLIFV